MRNKCRTCGNERKEGVEWYDDDYCSGKCKQADGGTIPPAAKPNKMSRAPASFADYMLDYPKGIGEKDKRGQRIKGRRPKLYRRRFEPEKINWGEPLSEEELLQAGLRCNRRPISGDWDYEERDKFGPVQNHPLGSKRIGKDGLPEVYVKSVKADEWQLLKAKAKSLGISTHAKKREQIEAEIREKENG